MKPRHQVSRTAIDMKRRHQVSRTAIDMIKRFEGYRRKAAQTPSGRWTLGYGHVLTARAGAEVSQEDAEALLLYDLIEVAHAVNELTLSPLNKNQFDALCSFVFNIGVANYRASTVLRRLNEGAILQAAACMEMWRQADVQGQRIVVDAIVRRRAAEKLLFLTPVDGWIPAPTPMMPPHLDHDDGPVVAEPKGEPAGLEDTVEVSGSASERAAAAVGARLQQIFSEPEAATGPALRLTPPPQFDLPEPQSQDDTESEPGQDGPTLFDVMPPEEPEEPVVVAMAEPPVQVVKPKPTRSKRSGGGIFLPLLLAVTGLILAGGALAWGLYADGLASGLDPRAVSWGGGLAGVSMMAFAAYLALLRLGGPEQS